MEFVIFGENEFFFRRETKLSDGIRLGQDILKDICRT